MKKLYQKKQRALCKYFKIKAKRRHTVIDNVDLIKLFKNVRSLEGMRIHGELNKFMNYFR